MPEVIPQKRIQHTVPVTQVGIIHVPTVVNQHRHHHVHVEQIVDVEVPQVREEVVHVPKIIPQERITQQI